MEKNQNKSRSKNFQKRSVVFRRWIFSLSFCHGDASNRFRHNPKSFWVQGLFSFFKIYQSWSTWKGDEPKSCLCPKNKTKACLLFFRKQATLPQWSYELGQIVTFYTLTVFLENSILYAWTYDSVFLTAFLFFIYPRHQSNWITLKRKKKEDVVISAFICSNTGELVNNIFQVFLKSYRRYFRDKKTQALGSFLTFHMWG